MKNSIKYRSIFTKKYSIGEWADGSRGYYSKIRNFEILMKNYFSRETGERYSVKKQAIMSNSKNNLSNMASLDIYLGSLSSREYEDVINTIQPGNIGPLLGMDIYAEGYHNRLHKKRKLADLAELMTFNKDHGWSFDDALILDNNYDALVLTDNSQTIQWVNKGFFTMTGYAAKYACGKKPVFLQGEKTEEETNKRIREKLKKREIFTEIVINYRKDKAEYKCELTIIPLIDNRQQLTHFLAIEKEVA